MRKIFIFFIVLIISGCDLMPEWLRGDNYENKIRYDEGELGPEPINLASLNTEYNDYNSAFPGHVIIGKAYNLYFSSDRSSKGGDYDFVIAEWGVYFDRYQGYCDTVFKALNVPDYDLLRAFYEINSDANQFGPFIKFLIDDPYYYYGSNSGHKVFPTIILYADDASGHLDIKATYNQVGFDYCDPFLLEYINSDAEDAYPCLTMDLTDNGIVFSSNREGSWDIYFAEINTKDSIQFSLRTSSDIEIIKIESLSSEYDDSCPYVFDEYLVFASNRPEGLGGYDLYASRWINGQWAKPENLGEHINSSYNEFRPLPISLRTTHTDPGDFKNDAIIFSSDRPEGKGGYDLYLAGIDRFTNRYQFGSKDLLYSSYDEFLRNH